MTSVWNGTAQVSDFRSRAWGSGRRLRTIPAGLAAVLAILIQAGAVFGQEEVEDAAASKTNMPPPEPLAVEDEFADIDLLELEVPIVVTAGRREQQLSTVPYAMSVITAEDIRRAGVRSIPDALRLVPGVDVADLSFGVAAVSPRGSHEFLANRVLVLVDGRQIFDSLFGGTVWGAWPFQMEDIQRIEVIRGPGGVSWGANAVNGVINIITKDPATQLGLTLKSSGGSRGTFKQHVGYGAEDGKLRLRFSGEYEASDGFRKGGSFWRKLEDDYKAGRAGVYAVYDAGRDDTLSFSVGSSVVDGGFSPTPLAGLGLRRNSGSQASFLLGSWLHRIADGNELELRAFVNDFHASPGVPAIDYRYQQIAFQVAHRFALGETHKLSWGIDSRLDLLDASNSDPFMLSKDFISSLVIGTYLQHEWRFAPKWGLELGGRLDYDSYGGFEPSARAALSYQLTENSVVYGSISRAFQMPPAALRFLDIPLLNGLARVTGHHSVDASSLIAYELGYRGRPLGRLDASVNLYWHECDDFFTLTPMLGPPALIRVDLDNRAAVSFYGVEADARYPVTKRLTLLGNYTFQRMDWRSSVPFADTDQISPPEHKFMVGARYSPTEDIHLSSHLYYVDNVEAPNPGNPFESRRVDSYFRLDLKAEYEFYEDRAALSVGVRNLLDSNHYEGGTMFLNDAEVPRMIYAEFRLAIK